MQIRRIQSIRALAVMIAAIAWCLMSTSAHAATIMYVTNYSANTVTQFSETGVSSAFITSGQGLSNPSGIVRDTGGNFYISNNTGSVRKYAPAGGFGTGLSTGGLSSPSGLALSPSGELYAGEGLADEVSKIHLTTGVVTSFAATGSISAPYGLAFDTAGNLYVACSGTNLVKKITPGGGVSNFGTGYNGPAGLAFDTGGNLYVSNIGSNLIRKILPDGTSSTFVSTGMNGPRGLAFDPAGNLYVANYSGNTISKYTTGGVFSTFANTGLTNPAFIVMVPEPASLGLLSIGGLALLRRRRGR
ncbi:MAG: PEP-CTERM sorting domain-containing protein [Burkholderiales bacterium]|nr:PEP-CTERM sorting domain-containing protein [Phycisphaerae bacterium]